MRKLQVEDVIFGGKMDADAISEADVSDHPVGRGQRFRGEGGIPDEFGPFVFDFVCGDREDFSFVDRDQ